AHLDLDRTDVRMLAVVVAASRETDLAEDLLADRLGVALDERLPVDAGLIGRLLGDEVLHDGLERFLVRLVARELVAGLAMRLFDRLRELLADLRGERVVLDRLRPVGLLAAHLLD